MPWSHAPKKALKYAPQLRAAEVSRLQQLDDPRLCAGLEWRRIDTEEHREEIRRRREEALADGVPYPARDPAPKRDSEPRDPRAPPEESRIRPHWQQRTRVSQLPHGWIQYWCPIEQTYYYYHPTTDHSTWEKPAQVSSSELPGEAMFRRKRFRLLCEMGAWGSAPHQPE